MRIITKKTLLNYGEKYQKAKQALLSWYEEVKKANWNKPNDLLAKYPNVRIIPNDRAIFDIKGNHYRLVVAIDYFRKIVFIRFFGTHPEYDKINAEEI